MLQRNTSILWRELDGEAVLLDPGAGCSYNLNGVGTLIWKLSDGTHSPADIAGIVCQHYEVEFEQACQDVDGLLAELLEHRLLLDHSAVQQPTA